MFLGVPYNIASYALLLLLYAKEANLKPGILSGLLIDSHIYQNHLPQVGEQLKREPKPLPTVEIPDDKWRGIFNWKSTDFVLKNYVHHEKLKGDVAR
jgi:thymidylate synthase